MAGPEAPFDRRLAAIFEAESVEHVQRMQSALAGVEPDGAAPGAETLKALFRSAHSLKGAARVVGADEIEALCHATEGVLAALQRGRVAWTRAAGDTLHEVVAALERGLRQGRPPGALLALVPRLQALLEAPLPPPSGTPVPPAPAPAAAPAADAGEAGQTVRIGVERLARLLYRVEALGSARQEAARHVARLDELQASFARLRALPGEGAERARAWQRHESLLRDACGAARRDQRQFGAALDTLLADVKNTLLLPVGSLRPLLAATVRELARSQAKLVELRLDGGDVEMDRRLLQELREPLLHLLRNAIAHGIEPPREREAAGKPARGAVAVTVAARGGRVEITVADDGGGVDTQRLAQAARAQDVPVAEDAGPDELLPLVFGAGVSTAPQLTPVAGRGIGLAIVRETVERLGGTVAVASTRGRGTTFQLALPLSLATYRAVEVRAGGRSFLLPTARTERCVRIDARALRNVGGLQVIEIGGQSLPLASLAALLGLAGTATAAACVVLAAGTRRVAVAVDEIRGEQEVMGRTLDPSLALGALVAGAAVLPGGSPAPILNVAELVRLATGEGGPPAAAGAPMAVAARPAGRAVLLADDSLTSRTLLKNILELAGHRVEVAVDGLQALEKLHSARFDVVVSDVEMPGLDGIGLTQAIRAEAALAHIPVLLVTSLGSPTERERGAEAGANAYIVKSSFDQDDLLGAIAELA